MPEIRGVDGCVMAVVHDILTDPAKERKFRGALAANRDGVPPYKASIRALNSNGVMIPELDESVLRESLVGPVAEYLARHLGCTLPTHPGIELAFLNLLAETAESRIAILKGEYPLRQ